MSRQCRGKCLTSSTLHSDYARVFSKRSERSVRSRSPTTKFYRDGVRATYGASEAGLSDIGEPFDTAPEDLAAIICVIKQRDADPRPRRRQFVAQAQADASAILRTLNLLCVATFVPHRTMIRATFSSSRVRTRNSN